MSTHIAPKSTSPMTIPRFLEKKSQKQPITMLTAYDATFARIFDEAGIDALLVGDSLGMVIQGQENTLPVTLDEIIYHTRAVCRGTLQALIVADLPFLTYHDDPYQAVRNAGRLLKEGGAQAVKLEGGKDFVEVIEKMVRSSIPVMGHLGLTPQSIHTMGGYKVQGKTELARQRLLSDAKALEEAGCFSIVLEAIPLELAEEITNTVSIPTIGIGAGLGCDGQILVCYDLLGLNPDFSPKFVKQYEDLYTRVKTATETFAAEVRQKNFPTRAHSFGFPKAVRATGS